MSCCCRAAYPPLYPNFPLSAMDTPLKYHEQELSYAGIDLKGLLASGKKVGGVMGMQLYSRQLHLRDPRAVLVYFSVATIALRTCCARVHMLHTALTLLLLSAQAARAGEQAAAVKLAA